MSPPSPGGSSIPTSSNGCAWTGWRSAAHLAPMAPTAGVSSYGMSGVLVGCWWGAGGAARAGGAPCPCRLLCGLPASWSPPAQPAPAGPGSPAAATGDAMAMAHAAAPACASAVQAMVAPSVPSAVMVTTRPHGIRATWYVLVSWGPAWQGGGAAQPGVCPGAALALGAGSSPLPAAMPALPCLQSATGRAGAARGRRTPVAFAARGAGCCMSTAASVRAAVGPGGQQASLGTWGAASQEPGLSGTVVPLLSPRH